MTSLNSVKYKIKLRRVLWIAAGWFVFGAIAAIFLHAVSNNAYIHRTEAYKFFPVLLAYSIGFGLSGLLTGSFLVFYLKDKFRNRSYSRFLLISITLILAIAVTMNILGYLIYFTVQFEQPFFHPNVWRATFRIFTNPINFKNLAFGMLLSLGTVISVQVNDKYGPGVFLNLLLGRYYRPREEERIFMFLDMKSSTTIAEKIGHIAYHQLLGEFFNDITDPIIYSKGEIYQYVGDEVIVSWKMPDGIDENNCVRCFFFMQQAIDQRKQEYMDKYSVVPEFKAGIHYGKVTVGEIGVVKKDIVFTGDVLNAAARIQSKCNELGAVILISQVLLEKLNMNDDEFRCEKSGEFELRGRQEKMILYSISTYNT